MTQDSLYVPGTQIEIIHPDHPRGGFRCALFDFDGTLSLVRTGWQAEMARMMIELLGQTPKYEGPAELEKFVVELIELSNGQQTIYQMIRLAEAIEKRGGSPADPLVYKQMFQERLDRRIDLRLRDFRQRGFSRDQLMVPGAREMLQRLADRGLECFLASGTDQSKVEDDLRLLEIGGYFRSVDGARQDYWNFSKRKVIERILNEKGLDGSKLIVFGDGFADMENGKPLGVLAVGLATDEVNCGGVDRWKRQSLIEGGADLILPDFRQGAELISYLFPGEG